MASICESIERSKMKSSRWCSENFSSPKYRSDFGDSIPTVHLNEI
jgi:hypothetical protein